MQKKFNYSKAVRYIFGKMGQELELKYQKDLAGFFNVTPSTLSTMISEGIIYTTIVEQILKQNHRFQLDTLLQLNIVIEPKFSFIFANDFGTDRLHSIVYKEVNYNYRGEEVRSFDFKKISEFATTMFLNVVVGTAIDDVNPTTVKLAEELKSEVITNEVAQVPFFMNKVNAGKGLSFETAPAKVDVSKYVLSSHEPKEVFIVEVSGNSMNQAGIIDGSTIIVKRSQDQKECINKVCVLTYQGETVVKYLLRDNINGKDVLLLRSKSTEKHKDIIVTYPEELILHGYVVTVATNF